jgi:hypothetical protein
MPAKEHHNRASVNQYFQCSGERRAHQKEQHGNRQ